MRDMVDIDVGPNLRVAPGGDVGDLPPEIRSVVLTDWVRNSTDMKQRGQARPLVDGELPAIGSDVVAQTVKGEVVGKVADYALIRGNDGSYRKGVYVYVPSSGSIFTAAAAAVRSAENDDKARLAREVKMAQRLPEAVKKAQANVREARDQKVQGSHLLEQMLAEARRRNFSVIDQTGFTKITGDWKGRAVYVAIKGGKANVAGFAVDHPAISPLSEDEARARHLGSVRGQFDFSRPDPEVLVAFALALDGLTKASLC